MSGTNGDVLWHVTMSLDGYIAGTDHAMEWAFEHSGPSRVAEEVMRATGAILGGRGWYEAAKRYRGRQGIYGGAWRGPVFVLTHRAPQNPDDKEITFLSDGLADAVATARAAAGGRNLVIFGANTARQCLDAGLLDEIVTHVAPVLLGDGVRLHGGPGVGRVDLERTAAGRSGQLTDLRFRVAR
jgi:dihydrofolate reductase